MSSDTLAAAPEEGTARRSPSAGGLSVRGIGKAFAGNWVLQDINLDVGPGEVVALLGENGAGKSTLSSIIAGVIPPSAGTMTWQGQPYAPESPGEAIQAGIGLIHQELRLLPELSIAENVFVGRLPLSGGRVDRAAMNRRAGEQLRRLGLDVSPSTPVRQLTVAAQQQVEIAKALTLNARLIILDEPTAALGGDETNGLFEQIEQLKQEGVGFIYISHRLEEISRIADRVVVLRDGYKVAEHDAASAPVNTLVEAMVGRSVDRMFPTIDPPAEEVALRVEGLSSAEGDFEDISFSVRRGEVFGIAGIVGAGRTELVRAIVGADPIATGTVEIAGTRLSGHTPAQAAKAGLVMVPEDRKLQGLIQEQTIAENMAIGNADLVAPDGWMWKQRLRQFAERGIQSMGVKGTPDQTIDRLSGGNQQKALIGKWIARNPKVFILDEPTRGIDVGARAGIYETIAELARAGMAVVVVSSDLEEVLGVSHRIMVVSRGRQRGILEGDDRTHVKVMELATT